MGDDRRVSRAPNRWNLPSHISHLTSAVHMRFLTLDVFTPTPFGGNQLAVFPDARAIPEGLLLKLCQEFNFSEVTFCYPPEDPANTRKVRFFTPD